MQAHLLLALAPLHAVAYSSPFLSPYCTRRVRSFLADSHGVTHRRDVRPDFVIVFCIPVA